MPDTCLIRRSVIDCHGHSRTGRQTCLPGSQHVTARAGHP
jgi:hypothetical protein